MYNKFRICSERPYCCKFVDKQKEGIFMQSNNKNLIKVILIVTGIILFFGGASDENTLLIFIGIICIILGAAGKKKPNAASTEIKSGTTQNMPANTTTIKSANLVTYSVHKSREATDHCPICMEYSGNGYCSKCGYRFN